MKKDTEERIGELQLIEQNLQNLSMQKEDVGYKALHQWVKRWLGSPQSCLFCGRKGKKNGTKWSIQWANKSHKYLRDLNDWIPLCTPCHKKYDKG